MLSRFKASFSALLGKLTAKAAVVAVLALAFVVALDGSINAQDFSRSYGFGGSMRVPAPPSAAGSREILNVNAGFEAGGILGCSGLDLNSMVQNQLGGIGNISDLSKDIANAAKTKMFNEALTRVFSDPQVASVLENIQGMAQARIGLIQKNCNANEIYADVTNKRLRDEAMQRCVEAEPTKMEACSQPDILKKYLGDVVASPKWSEDLHEQLCAEGDANCDWTLLIPNKKTRIGGERATPTEEAPAGGGTPANGTPTNGTPTSGGTPPAPAPTDGEQPPANAPAPTADGEQPVIAPAADAGEEVPAALSRDDILDITSSEALTTIIDRVAGADYTIGLIGYSGAMRAALYTEDGIPPEVRRALFEKNQNLQRRLAENPDDQALKAESERQASLYTMKEYMSDETCKYSLSENDFSADLTAVMGGGAPAAPAPAAPAPAAPAPAAPAPAAPAAPAPVPPVSDTPLPSGGGVVFPLKGQNNSSAHVKDRYRAPRPWCVNGRASWGAGCSKPHKGTDYRARLAPLVAAFDGIIRVRDAGRGTLSFYNPAYGEIKYRHMDSMRLGINVGVPVRAGQDVGISGKRSSGRYHLHVELWRNGVDVNPALVLGGSSAASGELYDGAGGPHGSVPLSVERTGLPPDHPFAKALQEKMDQMAVRTSNTARCFLNRSFHPQVYVKIASLQGTLFPPESELPDAADRDEKTPDIKLTGDKGSVIMGLSQMIGYDAVISTYTSTIREMSKALALKSLDGDQGINKPLFDYAKGQLALLRVQRSAAVSDYSSSCRMAKTVNQMNTRIDGLQDQNRGGSGDVAAGLSLDCEKYDHYLDDLDNGISELRNLYASSSPAGLTASSNLPTDP